jgi:lipid-A-disaccharide synthase
VTWLVIAGEPSGDRIAAAAVRARGDQAKGAPAPWGVGGVACRRAGVELVADASELAAMGVGDVLLRAPALARALVAVGRRVRAGPPRAALLANFTELSARIGPLLRRRGTRVLWCVAPQVWAWRPGRLRALAPAMDRLAVLLPFEEALWRGAGVDATFVGHPALELAQQGSREGARAELGMTAGERAVAILPGSRPGEIARLAEPLARAAAILRGRGAVERATLVAAPGIGREARALLERVARRHDLSLATADLDRGAAPILAAFDVSLCASGTASLEAALAGAPPVVCYRLDRVAYAIARRLVTTRHVALPNVLLGRRAFPELLQDELTPERAADEAEAWLGEGPRALSLAAELAHLLTPPGQGTFGERVAALMRDWL